MAPLAHPGTVQRSSLAEAPSDSWSSRMVSGGKMAFRTAAIAAESSPNSDRLEESMAPILRSSCYLATPSEFQ